ELADIRERMAIADERVHLREALVLERDTGSAALQQLAREQTGIVEIAKAAVAVDEHRQVAGGGHALDHIDELSPGGLVGVAISERGRDRQPGGPEPLEAGAPGDGRRQAVMRFHQEGELAIGTNLMAKGVRDARCGAVLM